MTWLDAEFSWRAPGTRILVVDGRPSLAEMAKSALEFLGYQLTPCPSPWN
jgi:hypothetical protein